MTLGSVPVGPSVQVAVEVVAGVAAELHRKRRPVRLNLPPTTGLPSDALGTLCLELSAALGIDVGVREPGSHATPLDRYLATLLGDRSLHRSPLGPAGAIGSLARDCLERDAAARAGAARLAMCAHSVNLAAAGSRFACHIAGAGPEAVVLVNALGQGLVHWWPYIADLARDHRLFAWELLQELESGMAATFEHQLDALEQVCLTARSGRIHLVGWCAGGKIALEFASRRPDLVRSVVVVNGSFRAPGRPSSHDTAYERALATICSGVARFPQRGAALRRLLAGSLMGPVEDGHPLAAMDADLEEAVREPFGTDRSLQTYAAQHLDYWDRRMPDTAVLADARIPVLLAGSELDNIVSAASISAAAATMTHARYLFLPGATHYRIYDRPDLVASMTRQFIASPSSIGTPRR